MHVYIIGKTGTGKSTLLENMALQTPGAMPVRTRAFFPAGHAGKPDLERGHGFALIEPHGDLLGRIAARVPASERHDVIYLDATDPSQPYGYNPLPAVMIDRAGTMISV